MKPVQGKNAVIYAKAALGDEYRPFGCVQEVRLPIDTEMLETTTVDSGYWRTYQPRINGWKISFGGVLLLRDLATSRYFALDLITEQVRLSGLFFKIIFTDDDGYSRNWTGFGFIPLAEIFKTSGSLSKWSGEVLGSGPFVLDDPAADPVQIDPTELYLTTTPGAFAVVNAALIGRNILHVEREGIGYTEVAGTPVNREFKFTSASGTITFDSAIVFNPDEIVYVLYR